MGILAHHLGGDLRQVLESRKLREAESKPSAATAIIMPKPSEDFRAVDTSKGNRT
jgi:hypothetical protein